MGISLFNGNHFSSVILYLLDYSAPLSSSSPRIDRELCPGLKRARSNRDCATHKVNGRYFTLVSRARPFPAERFGKGSDLARLTLPTVN